MQTHPDLYFGALAVKNGFATPSDIDLALEAQKEAPAAPLKLGEILAEMGTITREQVQTLLETQTKLRQADDKPLSASSTTLAPVQFEEIQSASLIQESGPTVTINGETLAAPRTLKSGDRVQAGGVVLRFSGDSMEIRPPAAPDAGAAPPLEPAAPKPSFASKLLPAFRAVDGAIARIVPSIHTQRKYVLAASAMGAIAFLLPWRIASNGNSVLGIQGPGWVTFLLALVPVALTLLTRPSEPFTKVERIVCSGAAGLAVLILVLKCLFPPSYAAARGVGLYLTLLSAASVLAAGAFPRAGGGGPSEAPPLGARLWKKLSAALGSISGKRAKELNAAIEQRDALLRKIGEAAIETHAALPEGEAALQAQLALEKAEKELSDPAAANVRAKAAQKAADAKAKRAFGKLAQKVLDGGLPLTGQDAAIAELRAAEARIKELSS